MSMSLRAFAVTIGLLAACARGSSVPVVLGASAGEASESERVVLDYLAAYNRHDVPGMLRLADSAIVWLSVVDDSVQVETRGAAALERGLASYFRSIPTARSTFEAMTSLGPWVTVRERAHWEAADGPRSQAAVAVYEVRDARIRRVWYFPVVR
jgi:hypothetical protein